MKGCRKWSLQEGSPNKVSALNKADDGAVEKIKEMEQQLLQNAEMMKSYEENFQERLAEAK